MHFCVFSLLVPDVITCVARYQRVTALELTDESTEPDPGIAFGCKQTSHTNFATWGTCCTHCVFCFFIFFSSSTAVQYHATSLLSFQPICSLLRSVFCCSVVLLCASTSGFCTECCFLGIFLSLFYNLFC